MLTIYQVLTESGIKFTRGDSMQIGALVAKAIPVAKKRAKVVSNEGKLTFNVFPYEEAERETIEKIIIEHFAEKKK